MVGLKNNSKVKLYIMKKFFKLFKEHQRSVDAYTNWDNVERICLKKSKNEHCNYAKIIEYRRFITAPTSKISSLQRDILSLELYAYRLVFINGIFFPSLSDSNTGLWKIKVENTNRKPLHTPIKKELFLHIIESLNNEITYISLPEGKTAKPLYLLHISQGSNNKEELNTLHYRHHIDMEAGSNGNVIEHFVSIDNQSANFIGARTTIKLNNNAQLNHIKLAYESRYSYHFSHNDIRIGQDATMRSSAFILGSGFTLHQTSAQMNGNYADLSINNLLLPSKKDIIDIRTYLEHNKSYCISRQLHKVIACDYSNGIFNGIVKVARNALKIDCKMKNNNLIIGKFAKVYTKPYLFIYNDDVKCSHGATVGNIDKEHIFYLCSRGIPILEAHRMIIYAFTAEIIDKIDNYTLRNIIIKHINKYLKKVDISAL